MYSLSVYKFSVKFGNGEMRITAEINRNKFQFFFGVDIRVVGILPIRSILKRCFGIVIFLNSSKKWRDWGIAFVNKGNANTGTVNFAGMLSCDVFMWQIMIWMYYSIHDSWAFLCRTFYGNKHSKNHSYFVQGEVSHNCN